MSTSTIIVTKDNKEPRAVVLLLGWWGAQMKHVQKYSQIYQDRECATVMAMVEQSAIIRMDIKTLDAFAQACATCVARIIRETEECDISHDYQKKTPVIIHSFSNGGSYPLWRLEVLVERALKLPEHQREANAEDLLLVGRRLTGEVFDSAPCFPHFFSALKAAKGAIPNPLLLQLVRIFFILHVVLMFLHRFLVRGTNPRLEFWRHMMESRLCLNQAFVYSAMDDITDVKCLDELITHRKHLAQAQIFVQRFDDSEHVQHLRQHRTEYLHLIDTFLHRALTDK